MSTARIVHREAPTEVDEVRDALVGVFVDVQEAILAGATVVLVIRAEDLLGHRSPEQGAYANAVVGLARAVAFEGVRPGWRINVVAVPADTVATDAEVVALTSDERMTGEVLVLGTGLLGRLAV
jgi:hypothetical protein